MASEPCFSISEIAREFDVTTRTIRFYEDKGLLTPSRRGNNRVYSKSDRTRLKLILRGRRLGWTLDEISEVIEMYHHEGGEKMQLEAMIGKLQQNRETLLQQQQDIRLALDELDAIEQNCRLQLRRLTDNDDDQMQPPLQNLRSSG